MPPIKSAPGKKTMRRLLLASAILLPASLIWLAGSITMVNLYLPGAAYGPGLILYPFIVLLLAGIAPLSYWAMTRIYRALGISRGPDEA